MDVQVDSYDYDHQYSTSAMCKSFSNASSSSFPLSNTCHVDGSQNFAAYNELPFMFPVEHCLLNFETDASLDHQLMVNVASEFSKCLVSDSTAVTSSQQQCPGDDLASRRMSLQSSKGSKEILSSLVLPCDGMEIDDQLSILYLLKAYGEAIEMEAKELAEEILYRLKEKASPTGPSLQRLAYYFIQALDKQVDFIWEESSRNYATAFRAFYEIFPYGQFAHFTANSVILEAMPEDVQILHIIDFDIGRGIQWPPLIEALARQGKRAMRFTAVRWDDHNSNHPSSTQSFDQARMQLCQHARMFGIISSIEEMDMEALALEMRNIKNQYGGSSEWLAFNCMVGLPHMGRARSVRRVIEFLKIAKESISFICNNDETCRGTITFGDGFGWEKGMKGWSGRGSMLEEQLGQLQVLLESMDCHFPHHFMEARIAMESLFLTPFISSLTNGQMWVDIDRESKALSEAGLEAWRMRHDNLMEAKELVQEGKNNSYGVSLEGVNQNEMVLSYMRTPVVTVSSWR